MKLDPGREGLELNNDMKMHRILKKLNRILKKDVKEMKEEE